MVSQLICTCDIRWLSVLVIGARMAVREPAVPEMIAELRLSDLFSTETLDSVVDAVVVVVVVVDCCSVTVPIQSLDLTTLLITAELLNVLLSTRASTLSSLLMSTTTLCSSADLSTEDDLGLKVEDDVEVGALVLMSSRSVELDRFLANFNMIKFLVLKIIT